MNFVREPFFNTFATKGLLAKKDGTCGAWENFMVDVLAAQGIASVGIGIEANQSIITAFKVNSSVPGQGTASPKESIWSNHGVVEYNGKIYDPSYGLCYGVKSGALAEFMIQSLVSVGTESNAPGGGIQGYGRVYTALPAPLDYSKANVYFWWDD